MSPSSTHAEFQPLPLLGNPHVQTILSSFLSSPALRAVTRQHLVTLPDGDRLALHDRVPARWRSGAPIAVLIHGLTGSHRAGYMQRLAGLLLPRGVRVVLLDLRGAGYGFALARKPYHAGCSDDVRAVLAEVHRWSPRSPLVVAGFSLGGNIALKLAGEASSAPVPGLTAVAAVGPPIDLQRCLTLLSLPRNRFYEQHFLRGLIAVAKRRQRYFREEQPLRFPRGLSLQDFDDLYTAPRSGFANARDYYQRASALPFIPRIEVPTLVLTARDDPFIAVEPFETVTGLKSVEVRIVERGGHLGFLGWDGAGGLAWAERRVMEWILQTVPRRQL
jgi:predicted alpha/beta-fold hydrolase